MLAHWTIRSGLGALALTLALAGGAAAQAVTAEEDPVLAVVNGEEIRLSEVKALREQLPEQYRQVPLERIFPALVDNLINTELAAADARKRGIPSESEFQREMEFLRDRALERYIMRREIEQRIDDAEVRKRYQEMVDGMKNVAEIRARHILVSDKAKAESLIEQLQGGADFAELAKAESTGPSGESGGDLGYFSRGQMVPLFEEAAFALEPGQITKEPVKTRFGWHVIKVEDRRSQEAPPFEEVAPQIRGEMAERVGRRYIEELRESADIQRYGLDGTPQSEMTPADTPGAGGQN